MTLAREKCVACRRDSPRVTDGEIAELSTGVAEWQLTEVDDIKRLQRSFPFGDFGGALDFTRQVGEAAESEGHHPRITLEWGRVAGRLVDPQDQGLAPERLCHGCQDRRDLQPDRNWLSDSVTLKAGPPSD